MDKKSFYLFMDSLCVLDELTDEQAGKLFKSIYNYQKKLPCDYDQMTKLLLIPFKNQFDRDDEKYAQTILKRSESGKRGGQASASKRKQKEANGSKSKQNQADTDTDKDKVTVTKKGKENIITVEMCCDYFKSNGLPVSKGKEFFEYYTANDWKDSKDNPVKAWKLKAQQWFMRWKKENPAATLFEDPTQYSGYDESKHNSKRHIKILEAGQWVYRLQVS